MSKNSKSIKKKKNVFIFVFRKETWKILYSAVILFVREKRGEKSSSKFNFEFFVNFLGMQGIWTVAFHWSRGFWVETTHANVLCNLKVQWMNLFSSTVNSFEVIYSFFFFNLKVLFFFLFFLCRKINVIYFLTFLFFSILDYNFCVIKMITTCWCWAFIYFFFRMYSLQNE